MIFTYDPKKYKLWIKVCEFAPKIVLICFKNVSDTCFWNLLQKKSKQKHFKIDQIWSFLGKIGKKHDYLCFFFDPTHFTAENRQTTQKFRPTTRHIQNHSPKHFGGHSTKIDAKNQKSRPPPPYWAKKGEYKKTYTF